jgi:hypothetical protein
MSLFTDASRVTAIGALPPLISWLPSDRSCPLPDLRHSGVDSQSARKEAS